MSGKNENFASGIYFSIFMACTHTVLELLYLTVEKRIVKADFIEYILVCMNGRLNWVPFTEKISRPSPKDKEKKEDWFIFDFDLIDISGKFQMEYQFTDETIKVLAEKVSVIPKLDQNISSDPK